MTDIDAISTQTMMPDNWLARANSAAPRTRGDGTFADAMGQEERTIDEKRLFGEDGFSFKTVLDTLNPLQHIPVVSTIYRELTGDIPSPASQVAGGALFGGVIGFVASLFNVQVEGVTGKDIGAHAVAALNEDKPSEAAPATAVAAADQPAAGVVAPGGKRPAATPPTIAVAKATTNVALEGPGDARPAAIAQAGKAPTPGAVINQPMTDDLLLAALTGRDPAAAAAAVQGRTPPATTTQTAALPGAVTPASLRSGDPGAARPGAIPIAPPVAGVAPRMLTQPPPVADTAKADDKPAAAQTQPAATTTPVSKPEATPGNPVRWMPAHPAGSQNFALPDPSRLPPALAQRVSDSYRKSLLSSGAGGRETQ
jgi:hypothetical protein